MGKCWGLGILLVALTLGGCGGGGSSSDTTATATTPTATTPTVGTVKKCLSAGGATKVSGALLGTGEGQHSGTVKAQGPGGGDIRMALYETPSEVEQAITLFASSNPDKSFEGVGSTLIVLEKPPAASDRKLAMQCAAGP